MIGVFVRDRLEPESAAVVRGGGDRGRDSEEQSEGGVSSGIRHGGGIPFWIRSDIIEADSKHNITAERRMSSANRTEIRLFFRRFQVESGGYTQRRRILSFFGFDFSVVAVYFKWIFFYPSPKNIGAAKELGANRFELEKPVRF
jgi:hypothetical protein